MKIGSQVSMVMSAELSISTGKLQWVQFLGYFDHPDCDQ